MNTYGNENKENDEAMEVEDSRKTESISTPSTPIKQGTKEFEVNKQHLHQFQTFPTPPRLI